VSTTVEVTQEDIAHGVMAECTACPIARALNRCLGGRWTVGSEIAVESNSGELVKLPDVASDFVIAFDSGRDVVPFHFRVTRG
jgi:hypothetical protein